MKRAALYLRVSALEQHPETQLHDLRGLAAQRGFEIVHEYTDRLSGAKAKRPGRRARSPQSRWWPAEAITLRPRFKSRTLPILRTQARTPA